jgi:hypothetical protein
MRDGKRLRKLFIIIFNKIFSIQNITLFKSSNHRCKIINTRMLVVQWNNRGLEYI